MSFHPAPATVTWRVVPRRTPHVLRPCARCSGTLPFASSDRFRVNASGRRLDVWLVYRCTRCDLTWNLTVVERTTPEAIGADLLAAYHRNDRDLAWRCAFDAALRRRAGARAEPSTPATVERAALPVGPVAIRFELPYPLRVRLDRILARELGVARSALTGCVHGAELRRPVRDGLVVLVDLQRQEASAAPGSRPGR